MSSILSDQEAVENVKGSTKERYLKIWTSFKDNSPNSAEYESRTPKENELLDFFRHLRNDLKYSSSSMWTYYSMLNAVIKGKYGERLQKYPRITSLLKSYDTDIKKKAPVFDTEDLETFVRSEKLSTPYWLVRKVIMIVAFFGGLRHTEDIV